MIPEQHHHPIDGWQAFGVSASKIELSFKDSESLNEFLLEALKLDHDASKIRLEITEIDSNKISVVVHELIHGNVEDLEDLKERIDSIYVNNYSI